MRRYYFSFLLPLPLPIGKDSGSRDIFRRSQQFQAKYIDTSKREIKISRFLGEPIRLREGLYFYEENEQCYEFFTGLNIGKVVYAHGCKSVHGKLTNSWGHSLELSGCSDNLANELTPSQFAFDVKDAMPYVDKIAAVMHEYLNLHFQAHDLAVKFDTQTAQTEKRNQTNASWLDDFISSR